MLCVQLKLFGCVVEVKAPAAILVIFGDTRPTEERLSTPPPTLAMHGTHGSDAYKVSVLVPLIRKADEACMVGAVGCL